MGPNLLNAITQPQTTDNLICKTPKVVGGAARIHNTRIPVWSLVQLKIQGATDEQIKVAFERHLTSEELAAAWDYYEKHKQEIDDAIALNGAE